MPLLHGTLQQQNPGGLIDGPLAAITTLSPKHYWLLDGTSTDHGSESKPIGTQVGVDTVERNPFAAATLFDVTGDYIRTTSTATTVGTSYTMSVWFRLTGDFSDNFLTLSAHGDSPDAFSSREYAMYLQRNAGSDGYHPRWNYFSGGSSISSVMDSGDYDIQDTDWHHWGCARETQKTRLWLDGQLIDTSDATASTVNNTGDFYYLGYLGGSGGSIGLEMAHFAQLPGILSDVQVLDIANAAGLSYPTWP